MSAETVSSRPDPVSTNGADTGRLISEAALFAAQSHGSQKRADRGDSYLVHLAEVAAMVARVEPFDPHLVAAAWLHDVLEDTGAGEHIIRERFGPSVADLVLAVTDPEGVKGEERRQLQVEATAAGSQSMKLLKIADKTSNVEELIDLPTDRFDVKGSERYLHWARKVVDAARGTDDDLEQRFDASAARLARQIDAAR